MSLSPLLKIIVAMFWPFDGPFSSKGATDGYKVPSDVSLLETVHLIATRSDGNSNNKTDLLVELVSTRSVFVCV